MHFPIRVGIAGFGYVAGVFHVPLLLANPDYRIVKVFERTAERSRKLCPEAEIVRSLDGLIGPDVDLAIILTPNAEHYGMAKSALGAGRHVIVDKPITILPSETEELADIARKQGVLLSVFQNRRWDAGHLTAKRIIASGLLGATANYEAHFDRYAPQPNRRLWKEGEDIGVSILYDLGTHLADQAVDMFGLPEGVYADLCAQRSGMKRVDYCQIILYYPGLKVVLSMGQLVREPGPQLSIHGQLGSYVKHGLDRQEALLAAGVVPVGAWSAEPESAWGILNAEAGSVHFRGPVESIPGDYPAYYRNIRDALAGKAELLVTPDQCLDVLRLLAAARESAASGQRIAFR
ncbi:MAG: Gfo/Idh/MocA family oxidoreductase [Planctomycetota bacterium]|jgi:predicted dehydrogenase|nr:Gfo/Idh/MocA family oxidoreductase [Planctomycetota bacterium]